MLVIYTIIKKRIPIRIRLKRVWRAFRGLF